MSRGFSLIETVIFIVLAAIVIPIFYLTTQPVIKDMMTPTSYVKARFLAEKKMEELMAYTFGDPALNTTTNPSWSPVTNDTAFPTTEYRNYQWKWAINYLDCNDPVNHCASTTATSLITTTSPGNTYYKQIDLTVKLPGGQTYQVSSAVTARY